MLPVSNLTNSQINRLGDRLRKGDISEEDRRLLDEYRRSFKEAYETVVRAIRDRLRLHPTGRRGKTTKAIIEKLRREKTRLSQMQDIAGCRIIATTQLQQDQLVAQLRQIFPESNVVDRRERTSHGYRAVHVIVNQSGKFIEVQIRTPLQHTWAELSEKLADEFGHEIKYGGGGEEISSYLSRLSDVMLDFETALSSKNHDRIMIQLERLFGQVEQLGPVITAERAKR